MKIALITDTHWGIRNDSVLFHDNSKRFLDDIFFPVLDEQRIDTVIHLGDLVDRRKYVNFLTAKRLREDFLDVLLKKNILMHIIAGNHDTFYKNTNEVNALNELLRSKYDNIFVWDKEPINWKFGETSILLLPWICDDNRIESLEAIKNSKSPIVMGHLELNGFEMYRGQVNEHGDDPRIFDKFDLVCSGHYHHRSTNGNIHYLGSHAEFTWSDYDDPRGFHILDTDTRELTFIQNPYIMFKKIWYNDTDKTMDQVMDVPYDSYKDKIVKVIVTNKTNPYWFDIFIERMEKAGVSNMQIVEDHLNLSIEDDSDIIDEAESTLDIFKKYIDQFPIADKIKKNLETTIVGLYQEAIAIE